MTNHSSFLNRPLTYSLAVLLLGILLTISALTHTVSSLFLIPGNKILENLRTGEKLTDDQIDTLIVSRKRSLIFFESGQKWTDIGLALLLLEARTQDTEKKKAILKEAIASLEKGLSLAPSNPWGWTRLTHGYILLEGPSKKAAEALVRAILVAPYEPSILLTRLTLVFSSWEYLPKNAWPLAFAQVRTAWRSTPDELTKLALNNHRLHIVRSALLEDSENLKKFEILVQKALAAGKH